MEGILAERVQQFARSGTPQPNSLRARHGKHASVRAQSEMLNVVGVSENLAGNSAGVDIAQLH